jgi:hypothetical protein
VATAVPSFYRAVSGYALARLCVNCSVTLLTSELCKAVQLTAPLSRAGRRLQLSQPFRDTLESHGWDVSRTENGALALALFRPADRLPGLILLDLMIPVMDGLGFRAVQVKDPVLSAIPDARFDNRLGG